MINIKDPDTIPAIFKPMLTEFRRVQVSRFPIDVEGMDDSSTIRFVDSRFPNAGWRYYNTLAMLSVKGSDAKGKPLIVMTSRLISNEKYTRSNADYHTRTTSDPKKVVKWLRDYAKPYSVQEIAERFGPVAEEKHYDWQMEARHAQRRAFSVSDTVIREEIAHLKAMGVVFRTEVFRKIADEGLALHEEAERRTSQVFRGAHVYVNPDESIVVGCKDEEISYSYDSLSQAPESIQQQLSMLRMVEDKTFVPDVGMRHDAKNFWIDINPNDIKDTNT